MPPHLGLEGGGLRNFDPVELPIPAVLVDEIREWARKYQETYRPNDPATSGFATEEEEVAFDNEGRRLRGELKRALGEEYEVAYYSVLNGWEGKDPDG